MKKCTRLEGYIPFIGGIVIWQILLISSCNSLNNKNFNFNNNELHIINSTEVWEPYLVDTIPKYRNGESDFIIDISEKAYAMGWGKQAWQSHLVLKFIVMPDGRVSNISISGKVADDYTGIEKAFIKALSQMKGWKPGYVGGKIVPVVMTQLIRIEYQRNFMEDTH